MNCTDQFLRADWCLQVRDLVNTAFAFALYKGTESSVYLSKSLKYEILHHATDLSNCAKISFVQLDFDNGHFFTTMGW